MCRHHHSSFLIPNSSFSLSYTWKMENPQIPPISIPSRSRRCKDEPSFIGHWIPPGRRRTAMNPSQKNCLPEFLDKLWCVTLMSHWSSYSEEWGIRSEEWWMGHTIHIVPQYPFLYKIYTLRRFQILCAATIIPNSSFLIPNYLTKYTFTRSLLPHA